MVIMSTIILVTSAMRAEAEVTDHIKPYGNLYMFYGYLESKTYDAAEVVDTDNDTIYKINNHSNLGFNFQYNKYRGVFELGIDDYENDREVKIRKAYGVYKLDFGELMIGQGWNPYVKWSHEAANYSRSEGFGALYEDPSNQIKFTTNFGAYIDIIRPNVATEKYYTEQEVDNPDLSDPSNTEFILVEIEREITTRQPLDNIKSMIPKIAIGYDYKTKNFNVGLGAAGNAYYIDKTENVEFNKNWIISYLFYFNSYLELDNFIMNLSGGYAINPANFGISVMTNGNTTYSPGASAAVYNIATGNYEIKDTWNVQGYLELGYKIKGNILLHLGYGFSVVDYPIEGTKKDYAMEYYLNAKFNLGGLIALTPAVSVREYLKDMDGKKEGRDIYAGVLATVSFY